LLGTALSLGFGSAGATVYYDYGDGVSTWLATPALPALPPTTPGLDLSGNTLAIGGTAGSFSALAGAQFSVDHVAMAYGAGQQAFFTADGPGTVVTLGGLSDERLTVGGQGSATALISGGAVVNAASSLSSCVNGMSTCRVSVGLTPGSQGLLTITGS